MTSRQPIQGLRCFDRDVIDRAAPRRPPGYTDAVRARNKSADSKQYCFTEEDIQHFREKFSIKSPGAPLPPVTTMIATAARAGMAEVSAIAHGQVSTSPEEQGVRRALCEACEWFTPNHPDSTEEQRKSRRCVKCGCYMDHKIKLRSAHCPVQRW